MKYQSNKIRFRHYGSSIEKLIEQAIKFETTEEKESAIITIGKLMKSFFQTWNREMIEDEQVLKNIGELSKGELTIDINKVKEMKLFEMAKRDRTHDHRRRSEVAIVVAAERAGEENTINSFPSYVIISSPGWKRTKR